MLTGVIENSMTLIYVKDLDGRYLLYNQPFADAFDLDTRGASEDRGGLEVLLGRDDVWLDAELQPVWRQNDLRAAEGSHFIEEWSDHPELGHLTYDSIKFPLVDADGEVYATCGISLDTSERSAAERAKDEFTSIVSHELRTPLTSIRGSLGLLAGGVMGAVPEKGQRMGVDQLRGKRRRCLDGGSRRGPRNSCREARCHLRTLSAG